MRERILPAIKQHPEKRLQHLDFVRIIKNTHYILQFAILSAICANLRAPKRLVFHEPSEANGVRSQLYASRFPSPMFRL